MKRGSWYWLRRAAISLGLLLVLAYNAVNVYEAGAHIDSRAGSVASYCFAVLVTVAGAAWQLRRQRAKRADPAAFAAKDERQRRGYFMTWGAVNVVLMLLAIAAGVGGAVGRHWVERGAGLGVNVVWGLFSWCTMLAIGGIVLVRFVQSLGLDRITEQRQRRKAV